ncbi:hypothetical protein [Synechococcus sp. PCC 7336]|uniref:hypothetical protein n=1 Tax=Synechococcus sp. PCC 7336 TaxID=195250 RepID=UPI0012EA4C3F|nr:hypothetical protein [Synechococcus sp. PCC 7336]
MNEQDIQEIRSRLKKARKHNIYNDRHACCWQGYLAALLEWDLISPNQHKKLSEEIPVDTPDPSINIFLGYE